MDAKHDCDAGQGQGPAKASPDHLDDFNLWLIFKLTPDFPDPDHLWDELVDYWSHVEAEAPPARRIRLARRIADLWTKRRAGVPRAGSGRGTSHAEWSALSASVLGEPCRTAVPDAAQLSSATCDADRAEAALDLAACVLERFLGMACRVRDFGRVLYRRVPGAIHGGQRDPTPRDGPRKFRNSFQSGEGLRLPNSCGVSPSATRGPSNQAPSGQDEKWPRPTASTD